MRAAVWLGLGLMACGGSDAVCDTEDIDTSGTDADSDVVEARWVPVVSESFESPTVPIQGGPLPAYWGVQSQGSTSVAVAAAPTGADTGGDGAQFVVLASTESSGEAFVELSSAPIVPVVAGAQYRVSGVFAVANDVGDGTELSFELLVDGAVVESVVLANDVGVAEERFQPISFTYGPAPASDAGLPLQLQLRVHVPSTTPRTQGQGMIADALLIEMSID